MRLLPQSAPSGRLSRPAQWSRALLAVCASTLVAAGTALAAPSLTVVISQVYGGGGNSGSTYKSDFIELHNNAAAPVSLDGWSVQYNSTTGAAANQVTALSGTIPAGGYYLIKQATGTGGTVDLPTPDTTGTITMGAGGFKVLLANTTTAFLGNSASNAAGIIDYVGCGSANIFEGAAAPAPSAANSVSRKNFGTTDTDNNSLDCTAGPAAPRNSATTPFIPTATGAPLVSILTPSNGATGIAVNSPLSLVFNKPIAKGTGNITVNLSGGSNVYTINVTDPAVVVSGFIATITLPGNLTPGASYFVNMPSGTFQDQETVPLPFAGISGPTTWAFTAFIPDTTAPTIISRVPANTATGVNPVAPLVINFSEPVKVPVFTGPLIKIKDAEDNTVATLDPSSFADPAVVTVSGSVATFVVPASTPLKYGESYYIEIEEGAFLDLSDNPLAAELGNTFWAFTTVDVPQLTAVPYTQTFATYTSASTLPLGWSFTGSPTLDTNYRGAWGTVTPDPTNPLATLGGFLGNSSVFGYHHTSLSNTTTEPLIKTLTLRNVTGAPITDLSIAYKGRVNVSVNTRIPVYTVSVEGTEVTALGYSTADGDNAQRNVSLTGLNIPNGVTFQIKWSSAYPSGAGSARQIGISDVSVSTTPAVFAPTVAALSVPVGTIGSLNAPVQANILGDGGQTLTGRGFVFAVTSVNPAPQIGGSGVTAITVASPAVGAYSSTLTGLTPNTNYTVSAYATNGSGTSYTAFATFTTLAVSPTFVSSYTQAFDNYNGVNPAGWTAVSDAVPPLQTFAGSWGQTASTGGFLGNVSGPGVLGYRHTGSSGNLTVTLRLVNGTGATLTSLNVSYLGRVERISEGRSPAWAVAVNNGNIITPVPALDYDTATLPLPAPPPADATKATTVTGLSIAAGDEFSITWVSNRGPGSGSSKQIGIGEVSVSVPVTPYTFASWVSDNSAAGGANGDHDNDGVRNSLEYFMRATGSSFTANPGLVGGKITWPKEPGFVGSYTVQTSPDLATWTNKASTVVGNTVEFTPTDPGPVFVRLQVVTTP